MPSTTPYNLDQVDLGSSGIGLGLRMDSKAARRSSTIILDDPIDSRDAATRTPGVDRSAMASSAQEDALDTPRAHGKAPSEQRVGEASSSRLPNSAPQSASPPRPRARARHARNVSLASDVDSTDVHLDAALNFVGRQAGPSVMPVQREALNAVRAKASRRRLGRDTVGPSSQETVRLRNDFRRAISRVQEKSEALPSSSSAVGGDGASEGMTAALGFANPASPVAAGASNTSQSGRGEDGELDEVRQLLKYARNLAREPPPPPPDTPPFEAIKRAINAPNGSATTSRSVEQKGSLGGLHTSASTPEGALGRIALPPALELTGDDVRRLSQNDSVEEVLACSDGLGEQPQDVVSGTESRGIGSSADAEALRAGLRFVLSCYDGMSKRAHDNKGLSNAIITSIAEGHTYQPLLATQGVGEQAEHALAEEGGAVEQGPVEQRNGTPPSAVPPPRARLRTGSILRALARGKSPMMALDEFGGSNRNGSKHGWGQLGSGLSSPARATQMNFDAAPGELVGPSTRLGMARVIPWQEADEQQQNNSKPASTAARSPPLERRRTLSNATNSSSSPAWRRNSRASQQAEAGGETAAGADGSGSAPDSGSLILSATLKHAQRELAEAREEKQRLMSEMEALSEQLFSQANEMVKQERIKRSALEKELDSLKSALSGANASNDARAAAESKEASLNIEAGAQNENEEMMMAAVAQASRECAEAEEEAEVWRKHCEELEARIAILEEALYNSMAILAEQEHSGEGMGMEDVWSKDLTDANADVDGHRSVSRLEGDQQDPAIALAINDADSAVHTPSGDVASAVRSQAAFSESVSSFYSADDEGAARQEQSTATPQEAATPHEAATPEIIVPASPTLPDKPSVVLSKEGATAAKTPVVEKRTEAYDERAMSPKTRSKVRESMHIDDEVYELYAAATQDHGEISFTSHHDSVGSMDASKLSPPSRRVSSVADGGSATSASSRPSSCSGDNTSRRTSSVSSKRQSRSNMLPPRLPEPVSPLPSIPNREKGFQEAAAPPEPPPGPADVRQSEDTTPSPDQREDVQKDEFYDVDTSATDALPGVFPSEPTPQSTPSRRSDGVVQSRKYSTATASTASSPMAETPVSRFTERSRSNGSTLAASSSLPQISVAGALHSTSPYTGTFAFDDIQWGEPVIKEEQARDDLHHSLQPIRLGGSELFRRSSLAHSVGSESRSADGDSILSNDRGQNTGKLSAMRVFGRSRLLGGRKNASSTGVTQSSADSPTADTMASSVSLTTNLTSEQAPSLRADSAKSAPSRRRKGRVSAPAQSLEPRKSARSAILNHMPPPAPQASESMAASIGSGGSVSRHSSDGGSFHEVGRRLSGLTGMANGAEKPPQQAFERRRKFNDAACQQLAGGVH